MRFSKSKYCTYLNCHKQLWMQEHMPEKEAVSADSRSRMDQGSAAGILARGYFGGYELAEIMVNGVPDTDAMTARTKELMASGAQVICEAAFACGNNYCAVDILRKEGGGWAIYEVKSKNSVEAKHKADAAYQRYVLEKCGINVTGVYIMHFNKNYMRHGDIAIKELFAVDDIFKKSQKYYEMVEENLAEAESYLLQKTEPATIFSGKCEFCGFRAHCHKDVPLQSVLNLRDFDGRNDYAQSGIMTFAQVRQKGMDDGITYNKNVRLQLEYDSPERGTYVDKAGVRGFLSKLSYPLCFLDFESFQYALPPFDNSRPWQQIPSQYSLHCIQSCADAAELVKNLAGDGHPLLKHTEFLGKEDDPRRALAEQLCKDIPVDACVVAYNTTFESTCLKELADIFPDLREHLLNIRAHLADIAKPFEKFHYYKSAMQGRYSIKYVLPAIYPSLNYGNLGGVHNGSEAMNLYPRLKSMPPDEQEKACKDLLEYCGLDTFAMVKLWQELMRVS